MNSRNSPPQALLASLETLASECASDALLDYAVRSWLASPARADLVNLARMWGVEPQQLAATVESAVNGIDLIERRRAGWRLPRQVMGDQPPPTLALLQLARMRLERVPDAGRRRRLAATIRKLKQAAVLEARRAHIQDFLKQPVKPVAVDLTWLRPLSSAAGTPGASDAA